MKYLLEKLKELYNDDIKKCPNIKDIKSPLINVEDILQAHYILADYFLDESGGAVQEKMLVGFEHTNGHKEYKKLNSELKAAISMYRKNKNDSSSIIKKLKLIISFVFLNDGKRLTVNHSVSLLLSLL